MDYQRAKWVIDEWLAAERFAEFERAAVAERLCRVAIEAEIAETIRTIRGSE